MRGPSRRFVRVFAMLSVLVATLLFPSFNSAEDEGRASVEIPIILAKGVSTYTPDAFFLSNTADENLDVIVEYSSCNELEAIESLEVWVGGDEKLMVKIKDGLVKLAKATYSVLPGKTVFFSIWGQVYEDTSLESINLSLKAAFETEEPEEEIAPRVDTTLVRSLEEKVRGLLRQLQDLEKAREQLLQENEYLDLVLWVTACALIIVAAWAGTAKRGKKHD